MTITPEALERLKACPFCGGEAEIVIVHLDDGENTGGSCVSCTQCLASGNVEFGRKENFVSNWNRRAPDAALEATQAENVRLREALEPFANACGHWFAGTDLDKPLLVNITPNHLFAARQALSTSGEGS